MGHLYEQRDKLGNNLAFISISLPKNVKENGRLLMVRRLVWLFNWLEMSSFSFKAALNIILLTMDQRTVMEKCVAHSENLTGNDSSKLYRAL